MQQVLKAYSNTNCIDNSRHFSDGSENSLRTGFSIDSKQPCRISALSGGAFLRISFVIFSIARLLVDLLFSHRQLTSR